MPVEECETPGLLRRIPPEVFVLGRHLNDKGRADVLWVPGANR